MKKPFLLTLIGILIVTILIAAYFLTQNKPTVSLTLPPSPLPSPLPSPSPRPSPSPSPSDEPAQAYPVTCADAQKIYTDRNIAFPEISATITKTDRERECQFTSTAWGISFLFSQGQAVTLSGAMGNAFGFQSSQKPDFYLTSYNLSSESSTSLSSLDKLITTEHGEAPYLFDSEHIISSKSLTIGQNSVNELVVQNGYSKSYEKRYLLIDAAHRILFEFSLFPDATKLDDLPPADSLDNLYKVIGSFQSTP